MKRKLLLTAVATTMIFGSAITANAAQEDVFDAEYYAETYPDVVAVFGDDENVLLQHYINYGTAEGRSASAYYNALAYKTANADLAAAFGDDWDAYADHFINYGADEGRYAGGIRAITDEEKATALAKRANGEDVIVQTAEDASETVAEPQSQAADLNITYTPIGETFTYELGYMGFTTGYINLDTGLVENRDPADIEVWHPESWTVTTEYYYNDTYKSWFDADYGESYAFAGISFDFGEKTNDWPQTYAFDTVTGQIIKGFDFVSVNGTEKMLDFSRWKGTDSQSISYTDPSSYRYVLTSLGYPESYPNGLGIVIIGITNNAENEYWDSIEFTNISQISSFSNVHYFKLV